MNTPVASIAYPRGEKAHVTSVSLRQTRVIRDGQHSSLAASPRSTHVWLLGTTSTASEHTSHSTLQHTGTDSDTMPVSHVVSGLGVPRLRLSIWTSWLCGSVPAQQ